MGQPLRNRPGGRGVSKEQLAVDFWLKDAAPSDALRRWYGHKPSRRESFSARNNAVVLREVLEERRCAGTKSRTSANHHESTRSPAWGPTE